MNLSVDVLNQEILAFNGDTAITKLDIQIGRGPFAPTVNRLIKIGETMTLVISVEGDPDFDLQVFLRNNHKHNNNLCSFLYYEKINSINMCNYFI